MKVPSAVIVAIAVTGSPVSSEEQSPGAPPTAAASAPSMSDAIRGLRNRFRKDDKPPAAAAPAPAAGEAPAAASAPGAPMKIKEFATTNSKLRPGWNDTHCRNLVEPFDLTDSTASLAKMKLDGWVKSAMSGAGTRAQVSKADIRKAARELNWLPMAVELKIGEQMHAAQTNVLREDRKSAAPVYARARRLLDEVVTQIGEPTPYNFRIYVTTAEEGNAESGPGGYIYVDKNLVDSDAQGPRARFAIAHEVSHVLQRHRTRETQMRLSDGVDSLEGLATLMTSVRANPGTVLKSAVDLKRMFVRHSEEQELQADGCAVRLIDRASRTPADLIASLQAFVKGLPPATPAQSTQQVTAEAVFTELSDGKFARHPSTEQRVQNLNAVLADLRAGR